MDCTNSRPRLALGFCSFLGIVMVGAPTFAATLYLSPSGSDESSCGAADSPCATFDFVFANRMVGGDELVVRDGTYVDQTIINPPSGSAGGYTIIRAENPGGAVITDTRGGEMLRIPGNYIQIDGFKFIGESGSEAAAVLVLAGAEYNKILRCGFVLTHCEGCVNRPGVTISGSHNLVEDCWAWGGGRYKFLAYGGDSLDSGSYNIFRRCVARHDREKSGGFNPQAAFANYQGNGNIFQNCLIVDSDQLEYYDDTWRGPFFIEKGQKGGWVRIVGSIAVGTLGTWIADNNSSDDSDPFFRAGNIYVDNSFVYGTEQGFLGSYTYHSGARTEMVLSNSAIMNLTGRIFYASDEAGSGFSGGMEQPGDQYRALNNIFYGVHEGPTGYYGNGIALHNIRGASDYNCLFDNGTDYGADSTVGTHDIRDLDPMSESLLYPVRVEAGSPLSGAGLDGSDIGPNIMRRIGVSGTLYGEPGFDTVTNESLWPWPNEDRIKADMSSYPPSWPADGEPNSVRGFTAGTSLDGSPQTLTKYVWEYLGNPIPSDVYGFVISVAVDDVTVTEGSGGETTLTFTVTLSPSGED